MPFFTVIGWIVLALALCGGLYAVAAAGLAARLLRRAPDPPPEPLPAVTILKPLNGDEPGLEDALASFLAQDYAAPIQIVFGVQDAADSALKTVERLRRRFPARDIAVVTDARAYGSNRKVSNLANMMEAAKHDVLVLADSDIVAAQGYLTATIATLSQPGVGAVSCLYTGEALGNRWSELAAMGVSYHFLPNACVGIASGMAHPSFGSTIALTRATLAGIGGFIAFADYLADDYEIGRAVRAKGLRLAYPPLTVSHGLSESGLGELVRHELRWARTIRVIDPMGHWGSFITHALPLALIGVAFLGFPPAVCVVLAAVLAARLSLKAQIDHIVGRRAGPALLLPARDMLSFGLFIVSLFGTRVEWRGNRLRVEKSGAMSQS